MDSNTTADLNSARDLNAQTSAIRFELCQPLAEQAMQIMAWRNDPITLSMFFHQTVKVWADFWPEYQHSYFKHAPHLTPLFALQQGVRVGFLRFSPVDHPQGLCDVLTVDISINLAPSRRGQGLGQKILVACLAYLHGQQVQQVYAEILSHNVASMKAFTAAGFICLGEKSRYITDTDQTHQVMCLIANTTNPANIQQGAIVDANVDANACQRKAD